MQSYTHRIPVRCRIEQSEHRSDSDCERGRIYTLAHAEMHPEQARSMLWQQLVSHPWWMTDTAYRAVMVHGILHPAPRELGRVA